MLIEFDNAKMAMISYLGGMWQMIRGSVDDYETKISDEVRALNSPRTRASQIHDFMRMRGVRWSESDPTIQSIIHRQMFLLVFSPDGFDGTIGIRFKKLDEDGMSRNQPTKQVRNFRNQMPLPGVQAEYHLEAGYVLDQFGTSVHSIDWVCPAGSGIYWKAEIMPHGSEQKIFNFPDAKDYPQEEIIVRRKSIAQERNNNEGTGTDGTGSNQS